MEKTMGGISLGKRIIAVLMSMLLCVAFLPTAAFQAWAEDDDSLSISSSDCTVIGETEDGDDILDLSVTKNYATADFSELMDDTDMVAAPDSESVTFEITANGKTIAQADAQCQKFAYSYRDYMTGSTDDYPLYTVTLPAYTDEVTISLSKECLVYNYDGEGNWLDGWFDDCTAGSKEVTVSVDADPKGDPDYIQIQNPYNVDYSGGEAVYNGGELLYAITFVVPGIEPSPESGTVSTEQLDSDLNGVYRDVFKNIESGLSSVGSDGSGATSYQHWYVIASGAINKQQVIDGDKVKAEAISAVAEPTSTNMSIAAIQLAAAGKDATKVEIDGENMNLLEKISTSSEIADGSVSDKAWALLAYASNGGADFPLAKNSVRNLIDDIKKNQAADGSFSHYYAAWDYTDTSVDLLAMTIPGLAAYSNDPAAKDALDKAVSNLIFRQNADGGFGDGGSSNANSTAVAVIALCSVGIDPANVSAGKLTTMSTDGSGTNALKALLSFANDSKDGFTYAGRTNDLASSQSFLAMAAYQGLVNTGKAYNVYLQASAGQAVLPADKSIDEKTDTKTVVASSDSKTISAKTGDYLIYGFVALLVLAIVAAGVSVAARKRDKI